MQYRNVLYMFEVYQTMVLRMILQSSGILWNLPLVAASPIFRHANLFFYRGSQARSRIDKLKKFRGMTENLTPYGRIQQQMQQEL